MVAALQTGGTYTDLIQDLVDIFNGKITNHNDQADISVAIIHYPWY